MTESRSLYWWSAEQLDQCKGAINSLLSSFFGDWGLSTTGIINQCTLFSEKSDFSFAGLVTMTSEGIGNTGFWISSSNGLTYFFEKKIFGATGFSATEDEGNLVHGLTKRCEKEFWTTLGEYVFPSFLEFSFNDKDELPQHATLPWSGFVYCRSDELKLDLIFSEKIVAKILNATIAFEKKEGALSSILEASSGLRQTFGLYMKPLRLELRTLSDLKEGDVIKLSHSLHDPIFVRTENSTFNFSAYLGEKETRLAVEFTK